jgi:serine/threonine protein phosphatase PrpC
VGDSRGVLARVSRNGGYDAVPLTKDHKPMLPEEKARIIASNGRVERYVQHPCRTSHA